MQTTDLGSKSVPLQITEGNFQTMCFVRRHLLSSGHVLVLSRCCSGVDFKSLTWFPTDEAAVYDRQIRLWGLEAQQRYALYPRTHFPHTTLSPRSKTKWLCGGKVLFLSYRPDVR